MATTFKPQRHAHGSPKQPVSRQLLQRGEALVAAARHGLPAYSLRLIVVMGAANADLARLVQQSMMSLGYKTEMLNLIAIGDDLQTDEYRPWWVQSRLAQLQRDNFECVVLDADREAVQQGLLAGLPLDAVVIAPRAEGTPFDPPTLEAMQLICAKAKSYCVLDIEAPHFTGLERTTHATVCTFGSGDLADVNLVREVKGEKGVTFTVAAAEHSVTFYAQAGFDVRSVLAMIALARSYGLSDDLIQQVLLRHD